MLAAATTKHSRLSKLNSTITLRPPHFALQAFAFASESRSVPQEYYPAPDILQTRCELGDDSLNTPYLAHSRIDLCTSLILMRPLLWFDRFPSTATPGRLANLPACSLSGSPKQSIWASIRKLENHVVIRSRFSLLQITTQLTVLGYIAHELLHKTIIMSAENSINHLARPPSLAALDSDAARGSWVLSSVILLHVASPI